MQALGWDNRRWLTAGTHTSDMQPTTSCLLRTYLQSLDAALFGLGLKDELHQHTLVLELVTLDLQVERVVPVSGGM